MNLTEIYLQEDLYQFLRSDITIFNFIQESGPDGLILWDLESPENFWMNPKLSNSLGYTYSRDTSENWEQHILSEDLKCFQKTVKNLIKENKDESELDLRFYTASGFNIWMKCQIKLLRKKNGKFYRLLGGLTDITKYKKSNLSLIEQITRYKHIIEGTSIGIWEWNIQTGEAVFNDKWAQILGYNLEEIQPTSPDIWKKLSHLNDRKKCDKILEEHLEGKKDFYECECRMQHKNGDWIWVSDKGKVVTWTQDGKPEWMTGFHEEITEMKERLLLKKSFIENAPSAIAMFDTQMNYIKTSKKWLEDYNIQEEDVTGKNHYEIFPEIDDKLKEIHQRCLNGETIKKEEDLFVRKDGTKVWLNWEVKPWYRANKQIAGIIIHTTDISHTMKLEQIAKEKQHFLEVILKNINVGVISCDQNGNLTLFNKATREWHGLPAKDIPPSKFSDYYGLYKPDGVTPLKIEEIPLLKALKNGRIKDEEMVIKPKNEIARRVSVTGSQLKDDKGNVTGAVIAMQDITHQKKAEEGLKNTIAKMDAIRKASTKTLIIGTDINGLITFCNTGSKKLLGYSKDELLYKGNPGMFHIEEELIELHKELLAKTNKPLQGFDLFKELVRRGQSTRNWTLKKKDGTKIPVQLTITSIKEGDEIVGYLGVGADISDLKKTEKELQSVLEVSQNQNERLKNFAHIVSHNLRSHSGNISMLLELFLEENPESKSDEMIKHLQTASQNLKDTIAHLNEVVMINTSLDESFLKLNLSDYINMAIRNIEVLAKNSSLRIDNEIASDVEILGVPAYLDSIILNFLTNGIKYRSQERESYIKLSTAKTDHKIILSIEDNGLGIDLNKNRRKLFGMYNTFHTHEDSRGIGLFITKNQVETMGGKIEVESELNKGTTFKIFFNYEKN